MWVVDVRWKSAQLSSAYFDYCNYALLSARAVSGHVDSHVGSTCRRCCRTVLLIVVVLAVHFCCHDKGMIEQYTVVFLYYLHIISYYVTSRITLIQLQLLANWRKLYVNYTHFIC